MQERKKDFGSYLWLFSFYSWMSIVLRSILAVFDWRTILCWRSCKNVSKRAV